MMIVEARLSVNLTAMTIDQVIAKVCRNGWSFGVVNQVYLPPMPFAPPRAQMQRSQVQLLSTMVDELAFAGAPRPALAPLTSLRSELSKRDPSYFNNAENFKESTTEALDVQREARASPFSGSPALPS